MQSPASSMPPSIASRQGHVKALGNAAALAARATCVFIPQLQMSKPGFAGFIGRPPQGLVGK